MPVTRSQARSTTANAPTPFSSAAPQTAAPAQGGKKCSCVGGWVSPQMRWVLDSASLSPLLVQSRAEAQSFPPLPLPTTSLHHTITILSKHRSLPRHARQRDPLDGPLPRRRLTANLPRIWPLRRSRLAPPLPPHEKPPSGPSSTATFSSSTPPSKSSNSPAKSPPSPPWRKKRNGVTLQPSPFALLQTQGTTRGTSSLEGRWRWRWREC